MVFFTSRFQYFSLFSGVPAEGVLVVTATGMLGAFLIPSESPYVNAGAANANQPPIQPQGPFTLPTVTESLGHTRNFITTADISYAKGTFFPHNSFTA